MISRAFARRSLSLGLVAVGVGAVGLAGCGANGPLEQPPPLFGRQATQSYYAHKAAVVRSEEQQRQAQQQSTAIADQESNTVANDQPKSTRDIPDPNQQLTTPRDGPVPGAPDPLGPTVSTSPPN